jgi:dGTPase
MVPRCLCHTSENHLEISYFLTHIMHWNSLFTRQRLGDEHRYNPDFSDPIRNDYLRDYDRLVFSSAFRRMQNKTQVFPLPGPVFVHNRLTHSLEVASVGRSLGKAVGVRLAEKYQSEGGEFREFYHYDLATVVATACLAHDIGNPPFGHSGESAIRHFFEELNGEMVERIREQLTDNQWNDLIKFEGNANAFRILTHERNNHKLTYTTLASVVKYPSDSTRGFDKTTPWISTKKSGYFDSEITYFEKIAATLQIKKIQEDSPLYARHPFVFLMEAADDICYRVIDLEDAHRLRVLDVDKVLALLLPFWEKNPEDYQYLTQNKLPRIENNEEKLSFLRAMLINLLIGKCTEAFLENEELLLGGTLQKSLIELLDPHTQQCLAEVDRKSVSDIYNFKSVVEIEVAGFNIIGGLLSQLVEAVMYPNRPKSKKLLKIIPSQHPIIQDNQKLYSNIQSVVDFIASMSDSYALDLYQRITGINIHQMV